MITRRASGIPAGYPLRPAHRPGGAALFLAALLGAAGCSAAQTSPRAIVDAETGQLYGGVRDGRWIAAEAMDKGTLEGAELVRYANDGTRGNSSVLRPVPTDETCSNPTYRPQSGAGAEAGTYLAPDWDAAPRRATVLSTDNPTYRAALSDWLSARGIADPAPAIAQLVRVDLEGDGRDEVVLTAERQRGSITSTRAGDYSVLLLNRLQGERVVTVALRADVYPEDCVAECAPTRYRLFSTLDLDGDGRLELIVTSEDYEGIGRAVYGLDDLTQPALAWHCGP
ncbi:hypothetical protein [Thiocapsa roseopersicina]|uniref:Repeat domain-containing protein n=1 Tax=Thiocapsa roseopersicina TaxID=1058 RepID=A0A1H3B8J4_THIRO|nr:hypothetical protein [Thiocapsa roseopersicina]SDX38008.1 hypothetical protein SAMN05421783_12340 [Thiocapsa roseopersicina]